MTIVGAIFWISLIALLYTYIAYPLFMYTMSLINKDKISSNSSKPEQKVSILIAAFNEEKVIREKLESIFRSDFPKEKIEVLVGSDHSTDRTNQIVKEFPEVQLVEFKERSGKVKIINTLKEKAKHDILILTDANVIFDVSTISRLVARFNDPDVGLVDTRMLHIKPGQEGIAKAEGTYIRGEVGLKYAEGKVFGTMVGPFGGCYAVRKSLYQPVPENFLVDDFYVNMKVLESRHHAVSEKEAVVFEQVVSDWKVEFNRKIRIAAGSFQNLRAFAHLLFRFNAVSFCFFSHKVLRWMGPFFLFGLYISTFLISGWIAAIDALQHTLRGDEFHFHLHSLQYFFLAQNIILLMIPLDLLLRLLHIHFLPVRLITHFFTSNLAILLGFFRFLRGIRSGIWKPTAR